MVEVAIGVLTKKYANKGSRNKLYTGTCYITNIIIAVISQFIISLMHYVESLLAHT